MMRRTVVLLSVMALIASACVLVAASGMPEQVIPAMFGVNSSPEYLIDSSAEAGLGFTRTEIWWSDIEKEKGVYDFAALDALFAKLEAKQLRAIVVLTGGNPLYEIGRPPHTREGREAFAAMARAAAEKHKGVIWQVWSAPNSGLSWKPKPVAAEYVDLVKTTSSAIKSADPTALVTGLSSDIDDIAFAERCFTLGLLASIDAVSFDVSEIDPSKVNYSPMRAVIASHSKGRTYPIIANHWPYGFPVGVEVRPDLFQRWYLTDILARIDLSTWGMTLMPEFLNDIKGTSLVRRLGGRSDEFVLLLGGKDGYRIAAWTDGSPREVTLPVDGENPRVTLTDSPVIIRLEKNERLALEEAVDVIPTVDTRFRMQDRVNITIKNPLVRNLKGTVSLVVPGTKKPFITKFSLSAGKSETYSFDPVILWDGRSDVLAEAVVNFDGIAAPVTRTVDLGTSQRISATPVCPMNRIMEFQISNPSGKRIKGKLRLTDIKGLEIRDPVVKFDSAGSEIVSFSLDEPAGRSFSFGCELVDSVGKVVFRAPAMNYTILETFADSSNVTPPAGYDFIAAGDEKVDTTHDAFCVLQDSQYTALQDMPVLRLRYTTASGDKQFRLVPKSELTLPGKPVQLGMWIQGDGNGTKVTCRLTDATGKAIQATSFTMDTKKWRYKTINLDTTGTDGPYRLDTLALIDPQGAATIGSVYLGPIMIVSE